MSFYKEKEYSDISIYYMFIEEGIIIGIHRENPPLMKTRKKLVSKNQDYYGKNYSMQGRKKLVKNGEKYLPPKKI